MYLTADFAGMWNKEHSELFEDPISRTGFIITCCGCPVRFQIYCLNYGSS